MEQKYKYWHGDPPEKEKEAVKEVEKLLALLVQKYKYWQC